MHHPPFELVCYLLLLLLFLLLFGRTLSILQWRTLYAYYTYIRCIRADRARSECIFVHVRCEPSETNNSWTQSVHDYFWHTHTNAKAHCFRSIPMRNNIEANAHDVDDAIIWQHKFIGYFYAHTRPYSKSFHFRSSECWILRLHERNPRYRDALFQTEKSMNF